MIFLIRNCQDSAEKCREVLRSVAPLGVAPQPKAHPPTPIPTLRVHSAKQPKLRLFMLSGLCFCRDGYLCERKNDYNDQDSLQKDLLHTRSWSSEDFFPGRRRTMTMTKTPSKNTRYTYGHGPLINLLQSRKVSFVIVIDITSSLRPCSEFDVFILSLYLSLSLSTLVALYRAMRLRFGYRFESCDANGPQNVKNTNLAKHRVRFILPFSLLVVRNWS